MQERVQAVDLLIVDDEVSIRRGVERLVTTEGFSVAGVGGGAEAIARIDGGLRPKVIFSDLMMPDMNGAELLGRLRLLPALSKVPIYIMSGGIDQVPSADGHIGKPFDIGEMIQIVARHCR